MLDFITLCTELTHIPVCLQLKAEPNILGSKGLCSWKAFTLPGNNQKAGTPSSLEHNTHFKSKKWVLRFYYVDVP